MVLQVSETPIYIDTYVHICLYGVMILSILQRDSSFCTNQVDWLSSRWSGWVVEGRACTSEAHDGGAQQGKAQPASHPEEGLAVGLLFLLSNEGGDSSVHHCCGGSHSAGCCEDQGRECAVLNLSPFHCRLSSSLAHSVCSIGLVGCCGDLAQKG